MQKINLLDHGFVRLVDSMGGDLSIVRAARVSYDAAWRAGENEGSDQRLIYRLWRGSGPGKPHATPFESVVLNFEVKAPIFVFRQWHRHRTWTYNELSARYRELSEEFYVPDADKVGAQSKDNKQGRTHDPVDGAADLAATMRRANMASFEVYRFLLESGVTRELARSVLPVSTYSHMFATVNLLNLMKFMTLRCDAHAQYEIRVYADAMRELARSVAPVAIAAWEAALNGP